MRLLGPLLLLFVLFFLRATVAPSLAFAQEQPPAAAPEKSEYDRLIDEALSEFDAGHFEEALSAFEQAYKVKPSARALRGVAKALFELRSYARCVRAIDRAFASDVVDPLTGTLRADLESLRARAMRFVGEAAIEVTPPNATVLLDGEVIEPADRGASAAPRVVDVGPHTLEVSAPDHEPQHRKLEIHGGEVTRVSVQLSRRSQLPPQPPPAPSEASSLPLALTIAGVVAGTGAVVGSSIWLVDRGDAVAQCNEAAASGAQCANADSIAFQRNVSLWTVGLSSVALVASTVALVLVIRGGDKVTITKKPLSAKTIGVWTW